MGGPEALFQVTDLVFVGPQARSSMPVDPALSAPGGGISAGSLGVLVDIVLGYSIVAARPPGHWSVSSEIQVEVLGGLRRPRGRLHAQGVVIDLDRYGGLARGRVRDDAGELLAVCSQRGRFVPLLAGDPEAPGVPPSPARGATDLADLLRARPLGGGSGVALTVSPELQNPLRNLHGGIALCAADVAAHVAMDASGQRWTTTSLQISYVRPIRGGVEAEFGAAVRHLGRALAVVDVVGSVAGKQCTIARVTLQPAD